MSGNKLSTIALIAIAIIAALAAVALWFVFQPAAEPAGTSDGQTPQPATGNLQGTVVSPQLTEAIALQTLRSRLFADCLPVGPRDSYGSCKVEMFKEIEGLGWKVWVTYDGLRDDSAAASRVEAYLTYQNGVWVASNVIETQKCWPGRGHQDFSAELCV